jgi:hypothetical protein
MTTISETNRGEGDPEAGKRFNEAETEFVESARGKQKVRDGANVRPDEESTLADAERLGKARSKGAAAGIRDVAKASKVLIEEDTLKPPQG